MYVSQSTRLTKRPPEKRRHTPSANSTVTSPKQVDLDDGVEFEDDDDPQDSGDENEIERAALEQRIKASGTTVVSRGAIALMKKSNESDVIKSIELFNFMVFLVDD